MHGSFLVRAVGSPLLERVGGRWPRRPVRRSVTGFYGRSLHRDYAGEWDFDLSWKPLESWPVFAGWVRAIRRGHAAVHRGLQITAPTLVLTSDRSIRPRAFDPSVQTADIVLDVDQIARWAPQVSSHLTLVRVPGAMHDVTLSREPARSRVFGELGRWLDAYVDA
jgi:alpha-beta hydrolase superfamily lysophospholipase